MTGARPGPEPGSDGETASVPGTPDDVRRRGPGPGYRVADSMLPR